MAKHTNLKSLFTDIANAIREKTGITDIIIADDFPDAIRNISSGGGITSSDVTAAKAQVLSGYTTITSDSNDEVVEGTMLDNGAMNKTIDGINTKSVNVPAGYTSGGTVSLTDDIDNEVETQAELISQIMTTLDEKVAGSGGVAMETCTVTITFGYSSIAAGSTTRYMPKFNMISYVNNDGNGISETFTTKTGSNPGNITRTFVMTKNQMIVLGCSLGSDITTINNIIIDGDISYFGGSLDGVSCYVVSSDLTITC